jgi:hypothetical protein
MSEAFYEVIVDDTLRAQVEEAVNAHKPPLRYHQARMAL